MIKESLLPAITRLKGENKFVDHSDAFIPVSEIFFAIQGEGVVAGTPTIFVRSGGCDFRCNFCDSLYAVDKKEFNNTWRRLSVHEIEVEIKNLTSNVPIMVTLSGGNPAIHNFGPLIRSMKTSGYTFCLETQATIAKDWFTDLDVLTLSPKPPSAGEKYITKVSQVENCIRAASWDGTAHQKSVPSVNIKIVIFDEADYAYARKMWEFLKDAVPEFSLSVGTNQDILTINDLRDSISNRYKWLIDKMAADRWYDVKVSFQQHSMIFGNIRGK